jgi:DNA-binding response OmpR family regulator
MEGKRRLTRRRKVANMRLLIVEDEARIAEILRSALSRSGFAVDAVGLCGDARAALEVNPYDAVILDLGLPDGDGLALLKDMRARGNAVPVLVLTARDAVEHRVVPKTVVEEKLYGIDDELESNAIPVHVHHLRRKLMERGATVEIHTVRGVGYLLVDGDA